MVTPAQAAPAAARATAAFAAATAAYWGSIFPKGLDTLYLTTILERLCYLLPKAKKALLPATWKRKVFFFF